MVHSVVWEQPLTARGLFLVIMDLAFQATIKAHALQVILGMECGMESENVKVSSRVEKQHKHV